MVPAIVEATGGITPHFLAHVSYLSHRAKGKGARDGTKYGTSRTSAKSFFVHHIEQIAVAAVQFDAKAIRKALRAKKQKMLGYAAAGGGAADAA